MDVDKKQRSKSMTSGNRSKSSASNKRSKSKSLSFGNDSIIRWRGHSLSSKRNSMKIEDVPKVFKMADRARFKRNKLGKKGEGDRQIFNLRPKHLLSGKRGIGKTQRR